MGCRQGHPDPSTLLDQAVTSYHRGELVAAQRNAEDGYRIFVGKNPQLAGSFRILETQVMSLRGMHNLVLETLANTPPQVFKDCEVSARRYMLQASANVNLGRDAEAEADMRRAESQCTSPSPVLVADLLARRGILLDPFQTAERDYQTALEIARKQHDSYREAANLLNLTFAAQLQEHYDQSNDWGLEALQISRKNGFKLFEEKTEGDIGWNYYKLGDYDRALQLSSEAEKSARIISAGPEQIRWRNNIGIIHEQLGQFALAETEYRQALAMAEQQGDKVQAAIALGEIAFVSLRAGKWDDAGEFSKQALEAARQEQDVPLEQQALLAESSIASHQGDDAEARRLLLMVTGSSHEVPQSLRWEAQAALADLDAKERDSRGAEAEYRIAIATASRARCSIHREDLRLPFFANTRRLYDSYIDFLVNEGKTVEGLRAADQSRALTLAEGLGVEGKSCLASEATFAPQKVAKRLQATVLFYWLGAEHSYLWAVTPERVKLSTLPGRAEIESHVAAYRSALLGPRDVLRTEDANGELLYRTLVAPAAELFSASRRVVVIADGQLSGLSFETLIVPQPSPHYWIEDVTIENASSLRLLAARSSKPARPAAGLLLIGDSRPPGKEGFAALPHAAEEMKAVGRYFSPEKERVFQLDGATASAYIGSDPGRFSYIHFVAHGDASSTDPLDSAVVLSPSQAGDGAYKLYAREVIAHPLQAELVTISSCKGAGARAYTGEGLVGLSWAFLHAGAHNVIGALWDVSDASTPQLMDAMYGELAKGSTPDAALRKAKLTLLHGQIYRKPIYWAAFQLYSRT